jgi:peptide/nickel transport system substrate-binding protein
MHGGPSRKAISLAVAAAILVAACAPTGSTSAPTGPVATPTPQRGAGGTLNIRFVQPPRILNPYLSQGADSDVSASRPVLESLAALGPDYRPLPRLAAEIPTLANGGFSKDLTAVTWRLRPNVKWSDGSDLTSADVVFTWRFIADKATGAALWDWVTSQVKTVEALDPLTVMVTYTAPDAHAYRIFVGAGWPIIQERQFRDYIGARAREAPGNLRPVGTGPYKIREFRPNDFATYEINENYREPNKPFFREIVLKGSGDPSSAARAAFETGEADFAVFGDGIDGDALKGMSGSPSSKGILFRSPGTAVERLLFNRTDPDPALGDMRSEPGRPHPFLTDLRVRQALAMAVDRRRIADLYTGGLTAEPTCNILAGVPAWTSPNTAREPVCQLDPATSERLLDQAGWTRGSDGVRQKGGVRLKVVFATTVNTTRQLTQAILKEAWSKIGVETVLKTVTTGKFFGNDPDAAARFFTDVEMFSNDPGAGLDATEYMKNWTTSEIKTRSANWTGGNYERWSNPEYDDLVAQLRREADEAKRNALYIRMNDILVRDVVVVPIVLRTAALAVYAKSLKGYSTDLGRRWDVADWSR